MTVQDGVDGAASGHADIVWQLAQQPFPKLASAPSWLLSPHGDNHCFQEIGSGKGPTVTEAVASYLKDIASARTQDLHGLQVLLGTVRRPLREALYPGRNARGSASVHSQAV